MCRIIVEDTICYHRTAVHGINNPAAEYISRIAAECAIDDGRAAVLNIDHSPAVRIVRTACRIVCERAIGQDRVTVGGIAYPAATSVGCVGDKIAVD